MFSPDGARVLTASGDGTARLWDAATGAETAVLRGHGSGVRARLFSPDGARVLTASEDGTAIIRPVETLEALITRSQGRVERADVLSDQEECDLFLRTDGC